METIQIVKENITAEVINRPAHACGLALLLPCPVKSEYCLPFLLEFEG